MAYPAAPTDGDFFVEDGIRRRFVAADSAWVKDQPGTDTDDGHIQAITDAEVRNFGYPKVATRAALDLITGTSGEIRTVTADGYDYAYNTVSNGWYRLFPDWGAEGSGGVNDWNDASNVVEPYGPSLLAGNATNGPGGTSLYHVKNIQLGGLPAWTQFAEPYARQADIDGGVWMRGNFVGTWSTWRRIDTADNVQTITGNGGTVLFPVVHNLGTTHPSSVTIVETATGAYTPAGGPAVTIVDANNLTVEFAVAPLAGATYEIRVVD